MSDSSLRYAVCMTLIVLIAMAGIVITAGLVVFAIASREAWFLAGAPVSLFLMFWLVHAVAFRI